MEEREEINSNKKPELVIRVLRSETPETHIYLIKRARVEKRRVANGDCCEWGKTECALDVKQPVCVDVLICMD